MPEENEEYYDNYYGEDVDVDEVEDPEEDDYDDFEDYEEED